MKIVHIRSMKTGKIIRTFKNVEKIYTSVCNTVALNFGDSKNVVLPSFQNDYYLEADEQPEE